MDMTSACDLPGSWTQIFKEVWQHKLMVKVATLCYAWKCDNDYDDFKIVLTMTRTMIMTTVLYTLTTNFYDSHDHDDDDDDDDHDDYDDDEPIETCLPKSISVRSWDPSARSASMASMGREPSFVQVGIDGTSWSNPKNTSSFDI